MRKFIKKTVVAIMTAAMIVSSVGTQSQLKCALQAGAKDFVQKPLDKQQVIDILTKFIEGR